MNETPFQYVGILIGAIAFIVAGEVRAYIQSRHSNQIINRQQTMIDGLVGNLNDSIKSINNNPSTIAAIQGLASSIPPSVFQQVLGVLSTARLFAPTTQLKTLDDNVSQLVKAAESSTAPAPTQQPTTVVAPPVPPDSAAAQPASPTANATS